MQWVSKETHMHALWFALSCLFFFCWSYYTSFFIEQKLVCDSIEVNFVNVWEYTRIYITYKNPKDNVFGIRQASTFSFHSTHLLFSCQLSLLYAESHWEANYGDNLPSTICIILEMRKSFTVISLLFFLCAGSAFVEECVAFVFTHM